MGAKHSGQGKAERITKLPQPPQFIGRDMRTPRQRAEYAYECAYERARAELLRLNREQSDPPEIYDPAVLQEDPAGAAAADALHRALRAYARELDAPALAELMRRAEPDAVKAEAYADLLIAKWQVPQRGTFLRDRYVDPRGYVSVPGTPPYERERRRRLRALRRRPEIRIQRAP